MNNSQYCETGFFQSTCLPVKPARTVPNLIEDVREGLLEPPRSLPPKYFYDEKGSQLFAEICATPEYYPTRIEDMLLAHHGINIIKAVKPDQILELGSGNSQKTRRLFDACEKAEHACSYAPFDVCAPMLEITIEQLQSDYDWLQVTPLVGDYHAGLGNLPVFNGRRLFVFLGSTIGNFTPEEARDFLAEIRTSMRPGDYLLLGADRVKDTDILSAAYNDTRGITSEFNLNLLNVLNRELDADFEINYFRHDARYNETHSRIEMRLVCIKDQLVSLRRLDEMIQFRTGDEILTEVSHKYTFDSVEELLQGSGFDISRHYQPENQYFSLVLAQHN